MDPSYSMDGRPNMNKLSIGLIAVFLTSCASHPPLSPPPPPAPEPVNISITGDKYWTLDFFYFHKGKQTHTKAFEFVNRRDCFDAMYQMQVEVKKRFNQSGSGICSKRFVEGQKRTQDDVLGYK
jgi:hypothetical protein